MKGRPGRKGRFCGKKFNLFNKSTVQVTSTSNSINKLVSKVSYWSVALAQWVLQNHPALSFSGNKFYFVIRS